MTTPERPDVSCFLPALHGGGAERVVLDLASAWASAGRTVEIVVASRSGELRAATPPGVPVIDLGRRRTVSALLPLARYLRRRRPRALLSTLEHANVTAVAAGLLAGGTRVVLREANTVSRDLAPAGVRSRALLWLMRRAYRRAAAVIAVSEGVASDLERHLGVPAARVTVIANPVLTERVWSGAATLPDHPWFAPGEPPVILGVGRLAPQKGFDTLLRAFAEARRRTACRLLILGEGELRDALLAEASALGIVEHVALPGFADDPFPYMAHAGAFALTSRWEGLPNALIQAVALGTPAVATDCHSGPAEVLDGGEHGALVPVDDVGALARALVEALARPRRSPPQDWLDRYRPEPVAHAYLRACLGTGGGT